MSKDAQKKKPFSLDTTLDALRKAPLKVACHHEGKSILCSMAMDKKGPIPMGDDFLRGISNVQTEISLACKDDKCTVKGKLDVPEANAVDMRNRMMGSDSKIAETLNADANLKFKFECDKGKCHGSMDIETSNLVLPSYDMRPGMSVEFDIPEENAFNMLRALRDQKAIDEAGGQKKTNHKDTTDDVIDFVASKSFAAEADFKCAKPGKCHGGLSLRADNIDTQRFKGYSDVTASAIFTCGNKQCKLQAPTTTKPEGGAFLKLSMHPNSNAAQKTVPGIKPDQTIQMTCDLANKKCTPAKGTEQSSTTDALAKTVIQLFDKQ